MGPPANLFPLVAQAAGGIRSKVPILGNDYPTKDGTGVRDYIHIMDLVNGHIAALRNLDTLQRRFMCINLGTGEGHSVMEVLEAFKTITGNTIPHDIHPRRVGDVPVCYADASLAKQELGWTATRGLKEMCASTWRHFSASRPHGIFIRPQ